MLDFCKKLGKGQTLDQASSPGPTLIKLSSNKHKKSRDQQSRRRRSRNGVEVGIS